jgi:hypothetical protein
MPQNFIVRETRLKGLYSVLPLTGLQYCAWDSSISQQPEVRGVGDRPNVLTFIRLVVVTNNLNLNEAFEIVVSSVFISGAQHR